MKNLYKFMGSAIPDPPSGGWKVYATGLLIMALFGLVIGAVLYYAGR